MLVLAASAIFLVLRREATHHAEDAISAQTSLFARTALRDQLEPGDLTTPASGERRAYLDALFGRTRMGDAILRVNLWSPGGTLVYSTEHALIGSSSDHPEELRHALSGSPAHFHETARIELPGKDRLGVKALEAFVPVRLTEQASPAGAIEVYSDYSSVASEVRNVVAPVTVVLVIATLLIWALLFPILRQVTRALAASNRSLHERAEELRLTLAARTTAEEERAQLEEQLRQALKMEAVGQLAGGIAHDFNNLLTVIIGYTDVLSRRLGPETEENREVAEIGKAAERAAQLTHQLLAYGRKQILEPRTLDLNSVVTGTETMLKRLIGEHIEFSTALAGELGSINADDGQIEQVIMNLAVNARDAMPEGGRLLLETRNLTLTDRSTNRRSDLPPGDYVVLAVADSGHGMDAATTERIFEPYYTTKARGAGTGLGLSTVYGIVKQSGGHIEVESEPGLGTTFRLYFPQVAEEAEPLAPKPTSEHSLMGSETILLVEDEEALRELGREMLEMYGYTVLLAADGAAALELAQNYPEPIQLLMTDILMPNMGGIELAERLSTLRSELKVLYTSGYNDSGGNPQMVAGARYLQKPYAMEDLARTLRELLNPPA